MTNYHNPPHKVNLLLALICALIVASYDRRWLAGPVKDLIPPGSDIRLERLSRLKGRLLGPMKLLVEKAIKKGRPAREPSPSTDLALEDELERVKRGYAKRVEAEGKTTAQEWIVEAYRRLKSDLGIGMKAFCTRMQLSERTFRSWRSRRLHTPAPLQCPEPSPRAPARGEGRFDLEHTLPGIQQMADTSEWNILGIPVKVMAVQDPGERHRQIFSAVAVAETESGQQIMDLIDQVAPPGTQLITDRGTPYVSQVS